MRSDVVMPAEVAASPANQSYPLHAPKNSARGHSSEAETVSAQVTQINAEFMNV